MNIGISHIGTHLPDQQLTNAILEQRDGAPSDEQIWKQTGIRTRRISAPDEFGSDLGLRAAEDLFSSDPTAKARIDYLIFCTERNDHCAPTTAARLAHALGLQRSCGTIDMPMGCVGFVNGLGVAKGLIHSGQAKAVLLITADVPSKVIHPEDHHLSTLFGDAAAATLVEEMKDGQASMGDFLYGTDGGGYEQMIVRQSGAKEPIDMDWLQNYDEVGGLPYGRMEMNGMRIFTFAMRTVPPLVDEMLKKSNLQMEDIDLFVFHQANGYILDVLRRKLNIEEERFMMALEHTGNTVSASIPLALKLAEKQGRWSSSTKTMLLGFGIGYTWGATILY